MAAVVINHLQFDVPVDEIADVVDRKFPDVFREQPGFQRFFLVKTGDREATVIIVWGSEAEAQAGAAVIGPGLFNTYLTPHLAAAQDRRVGKVVAEASI
jgi:hypothetical protein